jgi:hypothetical protein
MSNASSCRAIAARYQRLAEEARSAEARRAYERLAQLWLDMAPVAESFDRRLDGGAREKIYTMIDSVAQSRAKVA